MFFGGGEAALCLAESGEIPEIPDVPEVPERITGPLQKLE